MKKIIERIEFLWKKPAAEESIESKLVKLLQKCFENDLDFSYRQITGGVHVSKLVDGEWVFDESGFISDWEFETPEDTLDRLNNQVDKYEMGLYEVDIDE